MIALRKFSVNFAPNERFFRLKTPSGIFGNERPNAASMPSRPMWIEGPEPTDRSSVPCAVHQGTRARHRT